MNDYIAELTLDLNCEKNPPKLCTAQFDKGRKLHIALTSNGEPYSAEGCSAALKGVHSDGSHFTVECTVNKDGTVTAETNDTTFSVRGMAVAKLVISDDTKTYSTQKFIVDVDSSLDGDISSSERYSILNRLIQQVHALNESGGILVDDTLSPLSTNPIQNNVVYQAIREIQSGGYIADQQKISEKINTFLSSHPELTTTVQDGAIGEEKLTDEMKDKLNVSTQVSSTDGTQNISPWFYRNLGANPTYHGLDFSMQGYTSAGNRLFAAFVNKASDEIAADKFNVIRVFDFSSGNGFTDYVIDVEKTLGLEKSHANSMTVKDGVVYVTASGKSYFTINPGKLSSGIAAAVEVKTASVAPNVTAFAYDSTTEKWAFQHYPSNYEQTGKITVIITASDMSSVPESYQIPLLTTTQSIGFYQDVVYILYYVDTPGTLLGARSVIAAYKNGKNIKNFILPSYIDEIEDIEILDGMMTVNATTVKSGSAKRNFLFKWQLGAGDNVLLSALPLTQRIPLRQATQELKLCYNGDSCGHEEYGTEEKPYTSFLAVEHILNHINEFYPRSGTSEIICQSPVYETVHVQNAAFTMTNAEFASAATFTNCRLNFTGCSGAAVTLTGTNVNVKNSSNNITCADGQIVLDNYSGSLTQYRSTVIGTTAPKILAMGDSICYGHRNGNKGFVGDLGFVYKNIGVSGATLGRNPGVATIMSQLDTIIDEESGKPTFEPNVIILNGGTNDYSCNNQLLPSSDKSYENGITTESVITEEQYQTLSAANTDNNYIAAVCGLHCILYNLKKTFPNAKIIFVTTHKIYAQPYSTYDGKVDWTVTATRGFHQTELYAAVRKVCKLYGVKVADVFNDSIIHTKDSFFVSEKAWSEDNSVGDLYFVDSDGIHPLSYGYLHGYVPLIQQALREEGFAV